MSGPQQPPRCMFFELSAELRNKIYDEVLINAVFYGPYQGSSGQTYFNEELEPVVLAAQDGLQLPALLQTCRQIRNEAAPMYFQENTFDLVLNYCSPAFLCEWTGMAMKFVGPSPKDYRSPDCRFDVFSGDENRSNIIDWCRLVYDNKLPVWDPEDVGVGAGSPIVAAGHELVMQFHGRRWEDFLRAFEILCCAVERARDAEHGRW
ncbi:hypothetical protein Slin15195_G065270 [Septoria linicola]|uniref:Uncharacterized protein n=1 Tax=Septoria linicola TaxID=215465 RepID=A0A9Q9EL94_9PEZI|nr:hypothetical protein Slin14017_G115610 [Septoria linicola]USW53208.1 hypothetical protein Slin15195_G065270 [Septoria linicola]